MFLYYKKKTKVYFLLRIFQYRIYNSSFYLDFFSQFLP